MFQYSRHLDVSQSNESTAVFQNTRDVMKTLITSLKSLSSLDISGTNLAGRGVAESGENCDIPGLESRVENPLEVRHDGRPDVVFVLGCSDIQKFQLDCAICDIHIVSWALWISL
jgi:hypothetical protein